MECKEILEHNYIMNKDINKQLSRILWQERIKIAMPFLIAGLIVLIVLGIYIYNIQDSEQTTVYGKLANWTRVQTETGEGTYVISIILDNGSRISATASRYGRPPKKGERLQLVRSKSGFGFIRYRWIR